jgi:hypothetical protein
MNRPPIFTGRGRNINAVDEFVAEFKTFCIAHRIIGQQQLDLFDSLIRQPAQQEYEAALEDDTQMVWPAALAGDAVQNLIDNDLHQRLEI